LKRSLYLQTGVLAHISNYSFIYLLCNCSLGMTIKSLSVHLSQSTSTSVMVPLHNHHSRNKKQRVLVMTATTRVTTAPDAPTPTATSSPSAAAPASVPAQASAPAPAPCKNAAGVSAFQVKHRDYNVAEHALILCKGTQEVLRNSKCDQKISIIHNAFSPLQLQSLQASMILQFENKPVLDANGIPVTQAGLDTMIVQFANDHKITPQQACDQLNSYTNVIDFAKSSVGLLNNGSEVWKSQEKEVTFSTADDQQGAEESDGWAEDEDMFAGFD